MPGKQAGGILLIDHNSQLDWDAEEIEEVAKLIANIQGFDLGRSSDPSTVDVVLSSDEARRFGNANYVGATFLRQVLQIFSFDERRICSYRFEHKLIQALLLNHYAPGTVPITMGASTALKRNMTVSPEEYVDTLYRAGFFAKSTLGEASGELVSFDRKDALERAIKDDNVQPSRGLLNETYIFQKRLTIATELRVHSFQNQVIAPLTFLRYSHLQADLDIAERANAFVQSVLDRLPDALVRDSLYGWDVALDDSGNFNVIEINPTGMHQQYKKGFHCSGYFQVPAWSVPCLGRFCIFLKERYGLTIFLRSTLSSAADPLGNLYRLISFYVKHRITVRRVLSAQSYATQEIQLSCHVGYSASIEMNTLAWVIAESAVLEGIAPSVRTCQPVSETCIEDDPSRNRARSSSPGAASPCLHHLIEEQVERHPERTAVVFEDEHFSYSELNAWANEIAATLRGCGVESGICVAVLLERGPLLIAVLLAILKSGGCYVPLDPEWTSRRLQRVLEDCKPLKVVTTSPLQGRFSDAHSTKAPLILADRPQLSISNVPGIQTNTAASSDDNLCYVIYTSGSTGEPKGVMIEHRSIVNQLSWMQKEYALTAADTVLLKTPYTFDVAVWELFWPLMSGARIAIAPVHAHKDPRHISQLVERHQVSTIQFVPTMLHQFLDSTEDLRCSSLRRILSIGEALSSSLARRTMRRIPSAALYNLYGPTETTVAVTAWDCRQESEIDRVSIGRPVSNTSIYVLDANKQPVSGNDIGEIFVSGVQVARGYINRPRLTDECFFPDPFSKNTGQVMYATGDLGRWRDDGSLDFCGRKDSQVKLHGYRVEPREIELLIEALPGIRQSVVIKADIQDERSVLVAFFTTKSLSPGYISKSSLIDALTPNLPSYMIPTIFIELNEIPTTLIGKIDSQTLQELARERAIDEDRWQSTSIGTDLESLLARLLNSSRIDPSVAFLDMGLDSIALLRLANQLRSQYNIDVDLTWLFSRESSLDALANLIQSVIDGNTA